MRHVISRKVFAVDPETVEAAETAAEVASEVASDVVETVVESAVSDAVAEVENAVERAEERAENAEAVVEILADAMAETEEARERRALEDKVETCLRAVEDLRNQNSHLTETLAALALTASQSTPPTPEPSTPTPSPEPGLEVVETATPDLPPERAENEDAPPAADEKPRKKRRFLR